MDDLISSWQSGDGSYWVDVVGDHKEIDAWKQDMLKKISASPVIERAASKAVDAAMVISTGQGVYTRIPVMLDDKNDPVAYVDGLVLKNLLVTWRLHTIKVINEMIDGLSPPTDFPWVTTTSDLVAALCVHLSADLFGASQDLRRSLDSLSDEASGTRGIDGQKLNAAVSQLHVVDEVSGDYTQVFPMLRDSNSTALDLEGHHSRVKIAIATSHAVERRVKLYYGRIDQLRQRQAQEISDKTNTRLGMLSVLSAIFLPLTLLTGIFGMNFEHMPSLAWPWAYPALLLLMVTIALTLWRYFTKNNWV